MLMKYASIIKALFVHNTVIKFSSLVFIGNSIVNLLSFLFTTLMARMLSPKGFGEMTVILSLTFIIGIPTELLANVMTRYVARFKVKRNYYLIKKLISKATYYSCLVCIFFLVIYYFYIPTLSKFLFIDDRRLFIIIGLTFPLAFVSSIMSGVLFGLHKFIPIVLSAVIGVTVKLILAVLLIFWGFSTMGPILALAVSTFIAFIFVLWRMRQIIAPLKQEENTNKHFFPAIQHEIASYAKTILLSTILLTVITNIDIVLVKHYFSPLVAGEYAALATAGKLILYIASPVFTVMFPLLTGTEASSNKQKSRNILKTSFGIILLISLFVFSIFIAAPDMFITILFGQNYIVISPYLFWFGMAMFFTTFTRSFIIFFMAVHEKTFLYPLAISTVFLIALIFLFHQNIWMIVISLLTTNFFLFAACWLLYTTRMAKSTLHPYQIVE